MNRALHVAIREFKATVLTKGFIIGVFFMPLMVIGALTLMPLLMTDKAPAVRGRVSIIDKSDGQVVLPGILSRINPERYRLDAQKRERAFASMAAEEARKVGVDPAMTDMAVPMMAAVMPEHPEITAVSLPADADVEIAKAALKTEDTTAARVLAVVEIFPDAVAQPDASKPFGSYNIYFRAKLKGETEDDIRDRITESVRDARLNANGLDPAVVARVYHVSTPSDFVVTEKGERKGNDGAAKALIPMSFMMLLWISVFTAGQSLLTTTIEEKSSRVIEVLLSAVSPMQLMSGKIVGQLWVGLLMLGVYACMGLSGLYSFKKLDLIEFSDVAYLIVFFLIAFFLMASMMAAIGSAVNELREAQALMTPIMIVMTAPMMVWFAIMQNPNSTFAVVTSFLPPISPFVIVLRMGTPEGVPTWQILTAMGIGLVSVYIFVRAAAKIFRIGVLMYGKPPDFKTLIRWARMA